MRAIWVSVPLVLLAATAQAADVWEVYPFDRGGGTIAAVAAEDADSPEPAWRLAMTCRADIDWDLAVNGADAAVLGGAIASGAEIEFLIVDGGDRDNAPVHAYFPRIAFDQMSGDWGYSIPFGMLQIDDLAAAKALAVEGTGIAFTLPSSGTAEAFAEFRALCASLPRDDE
jgi:hypothetical protein